MDNGGRHLLWLDCHLTYFFLSSSGEKFDVIFIDADKENYIHYYKAVMDGKNSKTQIVCWKSLKKGHLVPRTQILFLMQL